MFPLIGILVAAGLLFKLRHKATASTSVVSKPTTPTTQAPTATTTIKPATKSATAAKPRTSTVKPSTVSQGGGYVTPSINAQVNDLLGQWDGTNPKVLNPTLPIGQYDPSTNSTGYQTPPIVVQPSPFNR